MAMKNLSIDSRMKEFYEVRNRRFLTRRTPVIIRIDGKAFHTYTRGLGKPFDEGLMEDMQLTTKFLCENIQGCKLGYVQSDEISLLLTDYDTLATDAWFDYCQNKMESIAASMATAEFNRLRIIRALKYEMFFNRNCGSDEKPDVRIDDPLFLEDSLPKMAHFDARAFNIPKEDAANYFVWRQQDATKNSIAMLAQSMYPNHRDLEGKNGNQMQEMCFQQGVNWNDLSVSKKRGTACYKTVGRKDLTGKISLEMLQHRRDPKDPIWQDGDRYGIYSEYFVLDDDTPIFSSVTGTTLINMIVG